MYLKRRRFYFEYSQKSNKFYANILMATYDRQTSSDVYDSSDDDDLMIKTTMYRGVLYL